MHPFTATPLYSLSRSGAREVSVFGWIAVHDGERCIFQSSDALPELPMRSLLKPVQFVATGLPFEEWDGKEGPFVAAAGSFSATPAQLEKLRVWYAEEKLARLLPDLKLPPGLPLDDAYRGEIVATGGKKDIRFNNCFSKHAAILHACEINGWEKANYLDKNHPYNRRVNATLCGLLGWEVTDIPTAVDGCLLPTQILGLEHMAQLYAKLGNPEGNTRLAKVRDLMLQFPDWVGGPRRMDSELMKANPGRVIAKEGADGLLGISVLPGPQFPRGLGIAVKCAAGYAPQSAVMALGPLLTALSLRTVIECPPGQTLEHHYRPFQRPQPRLWDISPPVDEKIAVWPGDVGFRRKVSLDTLQGQHLTLSSIETTVHVGAHTDAPNHFEASTRSIADADLHKYLGPCQVITVRRPPGSRIEWEHVRTVVLRAPRLLFRTESYPDPQAFNRDFVALSESLIMEAAARGVVLVGIDTPSIDPFDSKELPAHLSTLRTGVGILEGIRLSEVEDGVYWLQALPLRLAGADASPVRAVLSRVE